MSKLILTLFAFMALIFASCEKNEITPLKPDLKEKLRECRTCEGQWDLTDSTKRG
ncbi:MAG: hypothetical protein V4708_01785 [Bacteroidota bacterium]